MAEHLERKVGIVACSCEELAEGTVARLAALRVLNDLRPGETVTICLPLFLAGGAGDRAFAKLHPTITVDGCALRCGARGTERYSNRPAASMVVTDLVEECGLGKPEGLRQLNDAGKRAVEVTAERLAALVDQALGSEPRKALQVGAVERNDQHESREAVCSCGSGVPVTRVEIEGRAVDLVAFPLILQKFREAGRGQDEGAVREIFEMVKIYNAVPAGSEDAYLRIVRQEYADFCSEEDRT
jgi:hypothetical protein